MQKDINFKYEVAFSFLQQDEGIAYQINDLIQDRFSTFVYSREQEVLGGTDGEKTFNRVFHDDARIVIILYRDGWGQTAWTRIEETAIKNRAFNKGWEFLLVINLDKSSTLPSWIPNPYIWLDFQKYKSEGAIAVIDQKVRKSGGESRQETLEDRAKRFGRLRDAAKERDEFFKTGKAFLEADDEVESMITMLKEGKEMIEANNLLLKFSTEEDRSPYYQFGHNNYWLLFAWRRGFYEMKDRKLEVFIYERIKRSHLGLKNIETIFEEVVYKYDRDLSENNIWVNGEHSYSSKELVSLWVNKFIDFLSNKERNRR